MYKINVLVLGSGSGQTVYIIDTGIRHSHNDYGGRASYHWDYQSSVSIMKAQLDEINIGNIFVWVFLSRIVRCGSWWRYCA